MAAAPVFDFDGVLIDSLNEVIVTGYNLAFEQRASALDDVPPEFAAFMRVNRCRARSAGELGQLSLFAAKHASSALLTDEEFVQALRSVSVPLAEAERGFFEARGVLMQREREAWLTLNVPYQPIWSALVDAQMPEVNILTYKNSSAVHEICLHYGLAASIVRVYSTEGGASKAQQLRAIDDRVPDGTRYIDDSLRNLRELRTAFPDKAPAFFWAEWGYAAPQDKHSAQAEGFRPVSQAEAMTLFLTAA